VTDIWYRRHDEYDTASASSRGSRERHDLPLQRVRRVCDGLLARPQLAPPLVPQASVGSLEVGRSLRTTSERADRPRADSCFALVEQPLDEVGAAQLVLVPCERLLPRRETLAARRKEQRASVLRRTTI
jgi:hypothetical protein